MPDGDIIHQTLNRRFQNVYGQICEGHWGPSELGFKMLHPLKGQIKEYGNGPILMGQNIIPILEMARTTMEEGNSFPFADFCDQITRVSRNPDFNCSPRGRDLMVEAAKKTLIQIRDGDSSASANPEFNLHYNYITHIYKNDCESRIQETPNHYKNANRGEVGDLMDEIRPYVKTGKIDFAKQLTKSRDVGKLRRSNHLKEPPLTIEEPAW